MLITKRLIRLYPNLSDLIRVKLPLPFFFCSGLSGYGFHLCKCCYIVFLCCYTSHCHSLRFCRLGKAERAQQGRRQCWARQETAFAQPTVYKCSVYSRAEYTYFNTSNTLLPVNVNPLLPLCSMRATVFCTHGRVVFVFSG